MGGTVGQRGYKLKYKIVCQSDGLYGEDSHFTCTRSTRHYGTTSEIFINHTRLLSSLVSIGRSICSRSRFDLQERYRSRGTDSLYTKLGVNLTFHVLKITLSWIYISHNFACIDTRIDKYTYVHLLLFLHYLFLHGFFTRFENKIFLIFLPCKNRIRCTLQRGLLIKI